MGQSLNLYLAEPSGRKLNEMYRLAWRKGLKTTYYLRTLGASQVEKSTIQEHRLVGVAPLAAGGEPARPGPRRRPGGRPGDGRSRGGGGRLRGLPVKVQGWRRVGAAVG